MESAQPSILSTEDWLDGWLSDSTLSNCPLLSEDCTQYHTGDAENYGDIPIGLGLDISQDKGQLSCNDVTAKPQTINPNIVINGSSSEANCDSESSRGPYESLTSNKNFGIPYLENPIVDHRVDKEGRTSYLVWTSQTEMNMKAQGWVGLYWEGRNLLEKASGITQSKAICPKRRRVDDLSHSSS